MGFPICCNKCGSTQFAAGVYQETFLVLFCSACKHELTIDIEGGQLYALPLAELPESTRKLESWTRDEED